jgi:uncharacterized protein (TIGR03067 family)
MKSKVLLGLALSGLVALQLYGGEAAGGGAGKLEGTWRVLEVQKGGKKLPTQEVEKADALLYIKGHKYKVTEMGKTEEEGTFKTDARKKPHTIDLMITFGKDKDKVQQGIYKIEGDTLSINLAPAGANERPGVFTTVAGSAFMVYVLKREKGKPETK